MHEYGFNWLNFQYSNRAKQFRGSAILQDNLDGPKLIGRIAF